MSTSNLKATGGPGVGQGFRCNECGLDGTGDPKLVVQDRHDCSYGEVFVCPGCGSEDIDIGEFSLFGYYAPGNKER